MNLRVTAPVLGLLCAAGLSRAAAEESIRDGPQETFPVVCFLGPPADDNVLEHWQRIKDANFTVVPPSYQYDDLRMQMPLSTSLSPPSRSAGSGNWDILGEGR